ncbi:MAG: His/Gly/Thr/Pro-type tRNA ligase C-terminal domain-containing protein, partial [Chitinophagaceae bacterium]
WANVVRWEMRTRLFLRTTEFLWQEGHTAHATEQEAIDETVQMLNVYADFAEGYMAMPVIKGVKTPNERFAGALDTYCIEALMQDGKALQAGTSHFLGQNFAKAFDVKFSDKENKLEYVWATSWGVSTRLIGALVMAHSDDQGLILPPKIAPQQVVIVPIYKGDEQKTVIGAKAKEIMTELKKLGIRVKYDDNDNNRPGWKFAEYEMKGVPIRLAIGARDLEKNVVEVARRDSKEKMVVAVENIAHYIESLLNQIQENMFNIAKKYQDEHITTAGNWEEFIKLLDEKGGFISAFWDGTAETEEAIKEKTKATIRCIPLDKVEEEGKCILTGKSSNQRVLFARAY